MSNGQPPSRGDRIRRALTQPVTSVADALVPTLVDAVDFDETLSRVDVDELIQRVDIDALVARVDLQAAVERLDLNELLAKVDVEALIDRIALADVLARVDLNALMETVDLDQLLARIDVDRLVARIGVDALIQRVDVDALIKRVDVDAMIDRLDVNALMDRVAVDRLIARVDLDVLLSTVDLNALLDRIDVGALIARVDLDALLGSVDVDALIGRIDVDSVIQRVAVDALIQRVDVDALIQRVDVDALIQRVDVDALIRRVDVDALIQRVDVDALIQRVDVDQLVGRVDLDALIDRIDIVSLTGRLQLAAIVRKSTGGLVMSMLDLVRRQIVGVDILVLRAVDRLLRRRPGTLPVGPASLAAGADRLDAATGSVSGLYAGPASRLLAFFADIGVVLASFALTTALVSYLFKLVTGHTIERGSTHIWWTVGLVAWWFVYEWIGLAIAGRTIGKAVVGLRVVSADGSPLSPRQSVLRVIARPLSFLVLCLGLLMGLVTTDRAALHDRLVHTCVVYDWGDRTAEMPGPLTKWLSKRGALEPEIAPVAPL